MITDLDDLYCTLKLDNDVYVAAFRKGSDIVNEFNLLLDDMLKDGSLSSSAELYGVEFALVGYDYSMQNMIF